MAKLTALTVIHYWNGDSLPNSLRFETESLVDYCDYVSKAVEYWTNELRYGKDKEVQSVTIETPISLPDVAISRYSLDSPNIEIDELNVS